MSKAKPTTITTTAAATDIDNTPLAPRLDAVAKAVPLIRYGDKVLVSCKPQRMAIDMGTGLPYLDNTPDVVDARLLALWRDGDVSLVHPPQTA